MSEDDALDLHSLSLGCEREEGGRDVRACIWLSTKESSGIRLTRYFPHKSENLLVCFFLY